MNTKSITLFIFSLFMFISCIDEDIVKQCDAGLTLSFTTSAVITKADIANGYTYSNDAELKINQIYLAFFDQSNNLIAFESKSFTAASGALSDGRAYYEISNIPIKGGETLTLLTLANTSLLENEVRAAAVSPASFKALKESLSNQGATTFNSANLVKYGEQQIALNKGESKTIVVELTQLAARVDFTAKINVPDEIISNTETLKYTIDILKEYAKNPGKDESLDVYEYKGDAVHQGKWLAVKNQKINIKVVKTWKFDLSKIRIENVNTKSQSFLNSYTPSYVYNNEINNYSFDQILTGNSFSFYSYEKKPDVDNLTVKTSGMLRNQIDTIKTTTDFFALYKWSKDNGWGSNGEFTDTDTMSISSPVIHEPSVGTVFYNQPKSYSLIINPKDSDPGCYTNGLVHGNVYGVTGVINTSTTNLDIQIASYAWTPINIDADIKDVHYLFVKEKNVIMSNVASYEIEYAADLDININISSVQSPVYVQDGNKIKESIINYTSGQAGYPLISVDKVNNKINIQSQIPQNYFVKTIVFTVSNSTGQSEKVVVKQYPPIYMQGEVSQGGDNTYLPNNSDPESNPNLFTVTTIQSDGYLVGVSKDANGVTKNDVESNKIVSPKFIIASRYAVVASNTYTRLDAENRCKTYWETLDGSKTGVNATYPKGKWRLPTVAELQLLYKLQNGGLLANTLFNTGTNSAYWSAQKSGYVWFKDGNYYPVNDDNTTLNNGGGMRCVFDLY